MPLFWWFSVYTTNNVAPDHFPVQWIRVSTKMNKWCYLKSKYVPRQWYVYVSVTCTKTSSCIFSTHFVKGMDHRHTSTLSLKWWIIHTQWLTSMLSACNTVHRYIERHSQIFKNVYRFTRWQLQYRASHLEFKFYEIFRSQNPIQSPNYAEFLYRPPYYHHCFMCKH